MSTFAMLSSAMEPFPRLAVKDMGSGRSEARTDLRTRVGDAGGGGGKRRKELPAARRLQQQHGAFVEWRHRDDLRLETLGTDLDGFGAHAETAGGMTRAARSRMVSRGAGSFLIGLKRRAMCVWALETGVLFDSNGAKRSLSCSTPRSEVPSRRHFEC